MFKDSPNLMDCQAKTSYRILIFNSCQNLGEINEDENFETSTPFGESQIFEELLLDTKVVS